MTKRDARRDEEQRPRAPIDASTFRLNQQFMRAHGAPRGELTTLVTSLVEGGAFLSGAEQRR